MLLRYLDSVVPARQWRLSRCDSRLHGCYKIWCTQALSEFGVNPIMMLLMLRLLQRDQNCIYMMRVLKSSSSRSRRMIAGPHADLDEARHPPISEHNEHTFAQKEARAYIELDFAYLPRPWLPFDFGKPAWQVRCSQQPESIFSNSSMSCHLHKIDRAYKPHENHSFEEIGPLQYQVWPQHVLQEPVAVVNRLKGYLP